MLNKAAKTRQFWLQKEEWKNTNTLTNQENRVGPNGEEKRKNRIRKIVIIDAIFAVIVVGFFSELQNRNWLLPTSGSWSDARPTSAVKSKLKNQTKVHGPQRETNNRNRRLFIGCINLRWTTKHENWFFLANYNKNSFYFLFKVFIFRFRWVRTIKMSAKWIIVLKSTSASHHWIWIRRLPEIRLKNFFIQHRNLVL